MKLCFLYIILLLCLGNVSLAQQVILDCSIITYSNHNNSGIKILRYPANAVKGEIIYSDTVVGNEHVIIKFPLNKPTFLYFNDVSIYVHPNDSLQISLVKDDTKKYNTLIAKGKNAAYYNFSTQFQSVSENFTNIFSAKNYTKDDWMKYKRDIEDNEQAKVAFLKKYVADHHLNKPFYDNLLRDIKYQTLTNYLFYTDPTQVPAFFYNKVAANDFKKFISGPDYMTALNQYLIYLTNLSVPKRTNQISGAYLSQLYSMADKKFSGLSKKALMLYIFNQYTMYNMDSYRAEYGDFYNGIKEKYHDSATLRYIDSLNARYDVINKPIPAKILNSDLLTLDGKHVTLKTILDDHKNSLIYIDFWASWCSPCMQEIPFSISLHRTLVDKNITFIYISMDSENLTAPWIKASHDLGILENQYLLTRDINSPLAKYLSVMSIPKYVIIDINGKLISRTALRPSDKKTLGALSALVKN